MIATKYAIRCLEHTNSKPGTLWDYELYNRQGRNLSESLRKSSRRRWDLWLENMLKSFCSSMSSRRMGSLLGLNFTISPALTTGPDTKEATDKYSFNELMDKFKSHQMNAEAHGSTRGAGY